jgi:hypothetical protein
MEPLPVVAENRQRSFTQGDASSDPTQVASMVAIVQRHGPVASSGATIRLDNLDATYILAARI